MRGSRVGSFLGVHLILALALLVPPVGASAAEPQQATSYPGIPHAGVACITVVSEAAPVGPRITTGRQPLRLTYGQGDVVYIEGGNIGGAATGDEFEIVRASREVDDLRGSGVVGTAVEILGIMEILEVSPERALGRVSASCREVEVGDYIRPAQITELPELPEMPPFDPIRLIQVDESDARVAFGNLETVVSDPTGESRFSLLTQETYASGHLLTLDQGSSSGWSVGDMALFYSERPPEIYIQSEEEVLQPPNILAQGVIVHTEQTTSTVLIAEGDFEVTIGNLARNMGPAGRGGTGVGPTGNRPPTLSCRAERTTVRPGESVRVMATVSDPDGDATAVRWTASAGELVPTEGETVTWRGTGAMAGPVAIRGTASDGAGGTAECAVSLTPVEQPPAAEPTVLNFTCVEFPSGNAEVDNRCKAVLDDVALRLRQNPRATVRITGHSDSSGAADVNQTMSEQRAASARDYLSETHGIDASRIDTSGAGSSQPIGDNATAEGRAQNRRIEIVVTIPPGDAEELVPDTDR